MRYGDRARTPASPWPGRNDRVRPLHHPDAGRGRWTVVVPLLVLALLMVATTPIYLLVQNGRVVLPFLQSAAAGRQGARRTILSRGFGRPIPSPTPAATATPTPYSTVAANARMGCASGKPPVQPGVIADGANKASTGPPPQEVALTFDDGPTPYSTPPILDYLEQTHTPATFMVEGQFVHLWPYLVQREWRDGFAIGIHTWDHPDMTRLSPARRQFQLGATLNALHAALGQSACIWFWRPPYGAYNPAVLRTSASFGLTTIKWDVDPRDWSRPGTSVIVSRVLAQVHAGSIILMHDGPALRDQTRAALPAILAALRARGLRPVTLPKLLADGHHLSKQIEPVTWRKSG